MRRSAGFNIVELLVAITLSALVLAGLMSVFLGAKTSFQSTQGVGNVTEGGRFAIDFLTRTTRVAGVMGCVFAPGADVSNLNNNTTPELSFNSPMTAFEAASTAPTQTYVMPAAPATGGVWLPALPPTLLAAMTVPPVTGSDILIVRTVLPQSAGMYVTNLNTATSFTVNNAAVAVTGPGKLKVGGLALITDCTQATVFQIIGLGGNLIDHSAGGGAPGNAKGAFLGSYGMGAQVFVPDTVVYYIGIGADGDGALYSMNLNGQGVFQPPQELVSDIENMQLLFGVSTNGTNAVTQYYKAQSVPPVAAGAFSNVVSVKIAVLAASAANALPPPTPTVARTYNLLGTLVQAPLDRRSRKVFEATVAVRANAT